METVAVVTAVSILAGALAFVGWPLAEPAMTGDGETSREKRRASLDDEKERLLAALHDLDHDHATGKMEDADHVALTAKLKLEAARVLKEIDVNEGRKLMREDGAAEAIVPNPATPTAKTKPVSPAHSPAPVQISDAELARADKPTNPGAKPVNLDVDAPAKFCTKCGRRAKSADDQFCGKCGASLPDD